MAVSNAMPYISDTMQTYHNYASQNIAGIFDIKLLQKAKQFSANNMDSSILINDGKGHFTFVSLPHMSQISPGFGIVLRDFDLDGIPDCYLVHNLFHPQEELEMFGSGLSVLLKGTGKSEEPFKVVHSRESGIEVPGDAKSVSAVDINLDGREDFFIGINNSDPRIFINKTAGKNDTHPLRIRLGGPAGNPTAVGARVSVSIDKLPTQTAEISAGGGYLSQGSSDLIFALPSQASKNVTVTVRWPDGKTSRMEAKPESKFLSINRKE